MSVSSERKQRWAELAVAALNRLVEGVAALGRGRNVEWGALTSERERKIGVTYFWKGCTFADDFRLRQEALVLDIATQAVMDVDLTEDAGLFRSKQVAKHEDGG